MKHELCLITKFAGLRCIHVTSDLVLSRRKTREVELPSGRLLNFRLICVVCYRFFEDQWRSSTDVRRRRPGSSPPTPSSRFSPSFSLSLANTVSSSVPASTKLIDFKVTFFRSNCIISLQRRCSNECGLNWAMLSKISSFQNSESRDVIISDV